MQKSKRNWIHLILPLGRHALDDSVRGKQNSMVTVHGRDVGSVEMVHGKDMGAVDIIYGRDKGSIEIWFIGEIWGL